MKKCLFIVSVLASFAGKMQSQTNVSGFISSNTTWTMAGSPYIITGNTLLDSGFVLTIDPGVVVKFNTNKALQVSGTLKAVGTSIAPIIFTSNAAVPAPGDWQHVLFNDNSADYDYNLQNGSIMQYCILEYAGASLASGAIDIHGAFPYVNYCTMRYNLTSGVSMDNDPNIFGNPEIMKVTNCTIHHNTLNSSYSSTIVAGGINITVNQAAAEVSNNKLYNNFGQGTGGISMWTNNPNWTVANNIIVNNSASSSYGAGGGLYITGGSQLGNVYNNLIYGNYAPNGGGILLQDIRWAGRLSNNIVVNNTASVDGGGIYFTTSYYSDPSIQVQKNTVIENKSPATSGIYLPSATNTNVKYNTITRNHSNGISSHQQTLYAQGSVINYNNIYGNDGDVVPYYELYNPIPAGSTNNIDAKHNWWGTTSTSTINNEIYDYFEDGTLSIVNYNPIQSTPDTTAPVTPPVNVIKTDLGGGNIQITWTANQETDITGYKIYWGSPSGYSFANFVDAGNVISFTLSGVSITDSIAVTAYDSQSNGVYDQFEGHESWYTYAVGIYPPVFSAVSTIVCPSDTVFFISNTPETYAYSHTQWSWSFPGGSPSVSSTQNPKVFYTTPGLKTIKLKITNIAGSDSITYTNFINVNHKSYSTISPKVCNVGSYTSPSGNYTWYTSGTYLDSVPNYLGCDSVITVNLNISNSSNTFINPQVCRSYISPSGKYTWTASGNYNDTIPNYSGCDSVIYINLFVNSIDTSITVAGSILYSNAFATAYQWLNCANNYSLISGENNTSYSPTVNGSYAVQISQNACLDTSDCYTIILTGIETSDFAGNVSISPNPFTSRTTISFSEIQRNTNIEIINLLGTEIKRLVLSGSNKIVIETEDMKAGIYFLKITDENKNILSKKIIVQ